VFPKVTNNLKISCTVPKTFTPC